MKVHGPFDLSVRFCTALVPTPSYPYVIAYRLQSGVVEIITVIHGAQKWPLELD